MSHSGQQSANNLVVQSWQGHAPQAAGERGGADAMAGDPAAGHGAQEAALPTRQSSIQGGGNEAVGYARGEHEDLVDDDAEDIQYNLRPRSLRPRRKVEMEEGQGDGTSDSDNYDSDKMRSLPDSPRKGKRKVGRPIAYQGDINSPHLTEAERRRMKRRVDNRESARRVRNKRQSFLQEMSNKISTMKSSNASLKAQIARDDALSRQMEADIADARIHCSAAEEEGARLRSEVGMLRQHLGAPMEALQRHPGARSPASPARPPLTLSRRNTLSLPGSGLSLSLFASRDLPSLSQLTSQTSKELPFSDFVQMHRQNSQRPLPDMGGLGEIQGLTGIESLASQKQSPSPTPGKEH